MRVCMQRKDDAISRRDMREQSVRADEGSNAAVMFRARDARSGMIKRDTNQSILQSVIKSLHLNRV